MKLFKDQIFFFNFLFVIFLTNLKVVYPECSSNPADCSAPGLATILNMHCQEANCADILANLLKRFKTEPAIQVLKDIESQPDINHCYITLPCYLTLAGDSLKKDCTDKDCLDKIGRFMNIIPTSKILLEFLAQPDAKPCLDKCSNWNFSNETKKVTCSKVNDVYKEAKKVYDAATIDYDANLKVCTN